MRRIHIKAIHNRIVPPIELTLPGSPDDVVVPPSSDLRGSWYVETDELEHPELYNVVAGAQEMWFIDKPDEFLWGSITFTPPGPVGAATSTLPAMTQQATGIVEYEGYVRMDLADWVRLYDDQGT
jgi:hypothetical protein